MTSCDKHLPTKVEHEGEVCPYCEIKTQWEAMAEAGFKAGLIYVQAAMVCPLALAAPEAEPYRSIGQETARRLSGVMNELKKKLQGDRKIIPAGLKLV